MKHDFEPHRSLLLHLAYHLLGSMDAARDVVQDVQEKWLRADHPTIDNQKAYLSRMTLNRGLDRLRQLQRERENYPGPWLPEPVVEPLWEPEEQTLSLAILHLLERLPPRERAVYLLRECFAWTYEAIAELMQKRPEHCRQLLVRARAKIKQKNRRHPVSPQQVEALSYAFMRASQQADFSPLRKLITEEVILYGDGGGKATAARKPVYGQENCLRFLAGVQKQMPAGSRWEVRFLHGDWSALLWEGDRLKGALWLSWQQDGISGIYSLRNPDKLDRLQRQLRGRQ